MYAAIQQVDTSLRAMAACNCIKKRPTSTTKPHYLCGWVSNIGQPPVASARNMCARKKSRSRVSQIFQSLAQNAAHATRHAYLGTRHNVWYGTTTEQNGVESARGALKTNYCLVDHVRSLDPVPQRMKRLFWEGRAHAVKFAKNRQRMHSGYTI